MRHDFPNFGLEELCGQFGKTRAAIYDYQKRVHRKGMQEDIILNYVQDIRKTLPRVGTRKLHYMLKPRLAAVGVKLGRDQLFDLLGEQHLLIRYRRRKTVTTNSQHYMRKYTNKIMGKVIYRPEQVWVSDITYIRFNNQWGYLSLITDAYSRRIMGYSFRTDLTLQGCIDALKMACKNRQYPHKRLFHHSDRGSQYCSKAYVALLNQHKIVISMTKNGDPYENALAERMNGIIKNEFNLYQITGTFQNGYEQIAKSIEAYNNVRPHSSCNMLTPNQAHQCSGKLEKKWKKYPFKIKETSKKGAVPAPSKEQGNAPSFTVNNQPLSFKTRSKKQTQKTNTKTNLITV